MRKARIRIEESNLKKIRLESATKELQNSQEYNKIEMIVKQQADRMFGEAKRQLKFAFAAIIESLLNNPYRLQSFIEYSMLVAAFTSSSLCNANHNGNHEGELSFLSQHYITSTYDCDSIQAEYLRNIILN